MKIKIINNLIELERIKKSWKELFYSINSNNIYQHPNWHISWWKSFGKNKKMFIIYLSDKDKLVGVLPLALYRGGFKDIWLKFLGFSGGIQADRNNYIIDPLYEEEGVKLFTIEIEKILHQVDIMHTHSVAKKSKLLNGDFLSNKTYYIEKHVLPYIDLSNSNYKTISKSWKSSHRGDINRQYRRLNKLGKLTFELYDQNKEITDELIEEFLKVHSVRWNKKFDKNYYVIKNFYKNLIEEFKNEKIIHFSTLNLNNFIISFHFGFVINSRFYYYKPAYNTQYQNFSPGKIHLSKLIELSISSGFKEFDLLLGNEKYKYSWTEKMEYTKSYYVKGNSIYGYFGIWWFKTGKKIIRNIFDIIKK